VLHVFDKKDSSDQNHINHVAALQVHIYICMYVYTYTCMYIHMYVCMYVCILDKKDDSDVSTSLITSPRSRERRPPFSTTSSPPVQMPRERAQVHIYIHIYI
jgi:hypothetical protein